MTLPIRVPHFRLTRKKECRALTVWGWGILMVALGGLFAAGVLRIYPFLAVTAPIRSECLVVEGWIPDYGLDEIKSEFQKGNYKLLIITGSPIIKGEPLFEYGNYAEVTRAVLLKKGWDTNKVIAVPSPEAFRDRTFSSAIALKNWLMTSRPETRVVNLFSRGAHARRSRLLYEKAFHGSVEVGIIAGADLRYDGKRWWKTSEGVRDVIDETIAYLYARLWFRPK